MPTSTTRASLSLIRAIGRPFSFDVRTRVDSALLRACAAVALLDCALRSCSWLCRCLQCHRERRSLPSRPASAGNRPQLQAHTHGVAWRAPWWTGAGLQDCSHSSRASLGGSLLPYQTRPACRALRRHAARHSSRLPVSAQAQSADRGPCLCPQGVIRTCSQANPGYAVVVADDADVQETIRRAAPSLLPVLALLTPVERADLWHAFSLLSPGRGPCAQSVGSHELSADSR